MAKIIFLKRKMVDGKICPPSDVYIISVSMNLLTYSNKAIQVNTDFKFIYLFGVLHSVQHCMGQITMGSWKGRGNQYIQLVKVPYCKLSTNSKQLPAFPLEVEP